MKLINNALNQTMNQQIEIDKVISIILSLLTLFTIIVAIERGYYRLQIPVVLLIAALFYLYFRRKVSSTRITNMYSGNRQVSLLMNIIYIISVTFLIWLSWKNLYFRPNSFFVSFLIAVSSIIVDILLLSKRDNWINFNILMRILILCMVLYASIFYQFPGIYGTDPWIHSEWVKETISIGHITLGDLDENSYYVFPIFHIENAILQIITTLSYSNSIYLSVGFMMAMSCFFVFLLARTLVDIKSSLLIALIVPLTTNNIEKATEILPMSLGYIYFLILIFLIFSPRHKIVTNKILILIFSFTLIITHTIAAFVTLLCFIGIICSTKINTLFDKDKKKLMTISSAFILVFGITMYLKWTQNPPTFGAFFDITFSRFVSALKYDSYIPLSITQSSVNMPYTNILLNQSGFLIFLFFGLIGALKYLKRENYSMNMFHIIIISGLLFSVINGFSLFGIKNIMQYRWYIFLYIPMSILVIEGIYGSVNVIKNEKARSIIISFLLISTIFSMQINELANKDSPFIFNNAARYGYTQSEFASIDTLSNVRVSTIITDLYFSMIIPYVLINTNHTELTQNGSIFIQRNYYLNNPKWNENYKICIVNYDAYKKASFINMIANTVTSDFIRTYRVDAAPFIYNNGNVKAYILHE